MIIVKTAKDLITEPPPPPEVKICDLQPGTIFRVSASVYMKVRGPGAVELRSYIFIPDLTRISRFADYCQVMVYKNATLVLGE